MIKRRLILQIAGLTFAAGPTRLLLAKSTPGTDLKLLVVKDDQALPRFAAGDLLLADTRHTRFAGDGIYLYPNWGAPRPYAVSMVATTGASQMLEFRNPGNHQPLWTQSLALDDQFAGKLVAHFSTPPLARETRDYPLLRLPDQPIKPEVPGIIGNISGKV
jgi:hypothetical protein